MSSSLPIETWQNIYDLADDHYTRKMMSQTNRMMREFPRTRTKYYPNFDPLNGTDYIDKIWDNYLTERGNEYNRLY